ncbi:UNVERIFIED_CONTAM: hypothetical protein Slati_2517700 [Sesamum latifolium]|uniref:Uncharacterized protein n=1 Tax=Sesamum latifolium TaxID=2727402 RepID=A0AAW2WFB9_9LAMI
MAFTTRFLSRSTRQAYAGQSVLRSEYGVQFRSFAKGAGPAPTALKGDVSEIGRAGGTLRSVLECTLLAKAPLKELRGNSSLRRIEYSCKIVDPNVP